MSEVEDSWNTVHDPCLVADPCVTYDATACFTSTARDEAGHTLSGMTVRFALGASNTGPEAVRVYIITSTGDETMIYRAGQNWTDEWLGRAGPTGTFLGGPVLTPQSSTTLEWQLFFETPFDAQYSVIVRAGPLQLPTSHFNDVVRAENLKVWTVLTSNSIC